MKRLAKWVLRRSVEALPWGARAAVLEGPAARVGPARLIAQLAPRCRITTLQARGEYGVIQGAANDAEIFAAYAQSGTWARPVTARLLAFFAAPQAGTYVDVGANIGSPPCPSPKRIPACRSSRSSPSPRISTT